MDHAVLGGVVAVDVDLVEGRSAGAVPVDGDHIDRKVVDLIVGVTRAVQLLQFTVDK